MENDILTDEELEFADRIAELNEGESNVEYEGLWADDLLEHSGEIA